jgi:uncharacterized protein
VGNVKFRFRIPTWGEIQRTLRYHQLHVVHRSRDPHTAAFSFSLGVFLGLMPISVLATMLALIVPRRLGMRTLPCVIGTFTSNWITAPFIIAASAVTGQFLTTGKFAGFRAMLPADDQGTQEMIAGMFRQGGAFLVGICVVSVVGAIVSYMLVYWAVTGAVKIRQAKVLEKMRSRIHMPHLPHLPHLRHHGPKKDGGAPAQGESPAKSKPVEGE